MEKFVCRFQYFSHRLVYALPQGAERYESGAAEKENTLADTLREASEALQNAGGKLEKIESYYGFVRPLDGALQKTDDKKLKLTTKLAMALEVEEAYITFLQKWFELKRFLTEAKKWTGKTHEKIKSEQNVIDNMIAQLEELLSGFREKQKTKGGGNPGDPLYGKLEGLNLDEAPLRTVFAKRDKLPVTAVLGKVPEAQPKEKPAVAGKDPEKNTQAYWLFQISQVVQKLQSGGTELTPDQKKAIMFFCNPGKSRDYVYSEDGVNKHVTLQRDISGKFLRIVDSSGSPKDSRYIAFSDAPAAPPQWEKGKGSEKGTSAPGEKLGSFPNDLAWLKSDKARIGSKVSVNVTVGRKYEKETNTETFEKVWVNVIKGVDGYRVTTNEQVVTKNGKLIQGGKLKRPTSRDFTSLTDAEQYAQEFFNGEATFTRLDGTDQEMAAEKKYAEAQKSKALERSAGNVIRGLVPIFSENLMNEYMDKLSGLLTQYKIENWESKESFLDRFIVRVEKGVVQIVDLQPGGTGSPKGKENEVIAFQRKVNPESGPHQAPDQAIV